MVPSRVRPRSLVGVALDRGMKSRNSDRRVPPVSDRSFAPPGKGWRSRSLAWFAAFFALFLGITAWRWEIVDSPPYWDSAMGLFSEADFLAETGFDYRRLAFEEKRFLEGGKAVYITSILPTFVATLMTWLPSPRAVIITYRLFNFACAAVVVLLLVSIVRERAGIRPAILMGALLLSTPVFAVQIDMVGMDIPMLVPAAIAATLVFRERFLLAAGVSFLAYLTKSTGGLVTAATVVYLPLLLLARGFRSSARFRRQLWNGLSANLAILGCEVLLSTSVSSLPTSKHENFEPDFWRGFAILDNLWTWCPDIVCVFAVTLLLWLAAVGKSVRRGTVSRERNGLRTPILEACADILWEQRIFVFCWIAIFGMGLALALVYTIPRYLILPYFFLLVIFGGVGFSFSRWRRAASVPVMLLVGFNFANLDGRFLSPLGEKDPFDKRTGAILERSREYLKDHRQNIELIRLLERHYSAYAVVVPNPYVHLLSLPRLGYVERPLKGYAANTFTSPSFPAVNKLKEDSPQSLLFLWAQNRFVNIADCTVPHPGTGPGMEVLYQRDEPGPLFLSFKRWPARMSAEEVKSQYLVMLFGNEGIVAVARRAAEAGDPSAAFELLEAALKADANLVEALTLRGSLRFQSGDTDGAIRDFRRLLEIEPDAGGTHVDLGAALAASGEIDAAVREFELGVRLLDGRAERDPKQISEAERNWALALARQGKFEEAIGRGRQAVHLDPTSPSARHTLGQLLADTGDLAGARGSLSEAIHLRPETPSFHASLGIVAARQGDPSLAKRHLDEAVRLSPQDAGLWFQRAMVEEELLEQPTEAAANYRKVLSLVEGEPASQLALDAHLRLGGIAKRQGDIATAIRHYRVAVALDESSPRAANNLAWILATHPDGQFRDGNEAVRLAEGACAKTDQERPDCLDTLAAAYAEVGDWEKAIVTARRAADRARELKDEALARAIEDRRSLYEMHQSFRDNGSPREP